MRLHRFYISEKIGNKTEVILDNSDVVHQIRKVFRLKKGDLLIVFDGSGSDFTCCIEDFRDDTIVLGIRSVAKSRFMPEREVYLYAALVKKDTFEWIVEKATELGVTKIIPIIAERTEKKAINEGRIRKIAIEASEQSDRGSVPGIEAVISLKDIFSSRTDEKIRNTKSETQNKFEILNPNVKKIAFHTDAELLNRSDLSTEVGPMAVFIGPEGGWSPDEIALFHDNKISVKSIGTQVLRTETAVVATLSLVMFGK